MNKIGKNTYRGYCLEAYLKMVDELFLNKTISQLFLDVVSIESIISLLDIMFKFLQIEN